MKKTAKFLTSALALGLVAALSIGGTLAYLSDKDTVNNTFTVGKIQIALDEAKTNEDGYIVDAEGNVVEEIEESPRVHKNAYKILPGCKYHKDPTVHVAANSENCLLYITVDNNMAPVVFDDYILDQIKEYEWIRLVDANDDPINDSEGNPIFWRKVAESDTVQDFPVFTGFRTDMAADAEALAKVDGKNIMINAYAVQTVGWNVPIDPDAVVSRPVSDTDLAAYVWGQTFGAPVVVE